MKRSLSAKKSPIFSLAPIVLMGLSLAACDGESTLLSGEAGVATDTAPAVETQSADEGELAVDVTSVDITVDDATSDVRLVATQVNVQERLADIAESGSIRLMPMGDSITQGVRGAKSYRFELKNMITDSGCPMRFVGTQSANSPATDFYQPHEGYSGHAASAFLTGTKQNNAGAVAAINLQKPDVVLLHVGSVDLWRGGDVAGTLADIDQVIAAIESTKPGTLVLVANLVPWFSTVDGADRPVLVQELGSQIESYVSESNNPNLSLVDVRTGYSVELMQSDLIHPNEQGDAHIADAFFDQIFSADYCG